MLYTWARCLIRGSAGGPFCTVSTEIFSLDSNGGFISLCVKLRSMENGTPNSIVSNYCCLCQTCYAPASLLVPSSLVFYCTLFCVDNY